MAGQDDVTRILQPAGDESPRRQPADRRLPDQVSHYRLGKKLGAGGMGVVYVGVDERLGRKVAVKLLPAAAEENIDQRMRMLREAQAASALNHPGIVTLHDVGAHEGRLFLVMELIDGDSFRTVAMNGVAPAEALRLTAEAADALAAAHAAGILHRDVKSDNLMRTRHGRVKVLDFGLAKILDETMSAPSEAMRELASGPQFVVGPEGLTPAPEPAPLETREGTILGTPPYMAPEQTHGADITERSEVFSLGVVLYELLTGERPFARGNLPETIAAVRACQPPLPSTRRPGIAPEINALVMRAMARNPDDRFPDMAAFAAAIRALDLSPPRRRRWPLFAAGGGVALLGAAAILLGIRPGETGPTAHSAAQRLTFDPGCEEFPSFTPDGKAIVFDTQIDGDYELVAMDIASATRRRVTRARGWDYAATVSPDGKRIAYTHQSESNSVRVLPLSGEGEPIQLGQADGYAAWSRRGTLLFGVQDRIMEWDPAGGLRAAATIPGNRRAIYLAPFPDGAVYALLGTLDQEVPPSISVLENGTLRPTDIVDAAEYPIAASPDGMHLYYHRNAAAGVELVRRPRGAGRATVLAGGIAPTGGLAFAPGGGRLAFSSCKSTSFVARIAGGRTQPLTRAGGWTDAYPTAVDVKHLLFTSDRAGSSQIWRLDMTNGAATPVTAAGTLRATVAPDRRRVAWAALDPPGIMVAPLGPDGVPGEARRLTGDKGDTAPQFSHDGAQVLFVRIEGSDGERVWAMPTAGGEPRPITPHRATVISTSPVADEIVYLSARGAAGVDVLATDLSGRPPVLIVALPPGVFRSLRHSPDGRRLIVIREDQEILEIDRTALPASVSSLWRGGVESATAVDYAPDGDGLVASVVVWEGDLWIVDGSF